MFCHVLPDGLGPTEGHTFVIYPILNSPVEFVWKTFLIFAFHGFQFRQSLYFIQASDIIPSV